LSEKRSDAITAELIESVRQRLIDGKRVRKTLPGGGRLHIDRPLPFLCVYRRPVRRRDEGTRRLVTTEASYLVAPGGKRHRDGVAALIAAIASAIAESYGAFLILEIWPENSRADPIHASGNPPSPRFEVVVRAGGPARLASRLRDQLANIVIDKRAAKVTIKKARTVSPRGQPELLAPAQARAASSTLLGLRVRPIYRDHGSGDSYPLLLRETRRALSRALRPLLYDFVRTNTVYRPGHYHVLGRRAMVKAVWEVDRQLAEVADSFDFLLTVTPINSAQAWRQFKHDRFERAPEFYYRPLPVDPVVLQRRLYNVPVEGIEDPALSYMFRQKQLELGRQLSMQSDRDTPDFLFGSLQLFGGVEDELFERALGLLEELPPHSREDSSKGTLDAKAFAERARTELGHYRAVWPEMNGRVEVRDDIASGLMVSHGSLLVGRETRIPMSRVEALLQHEVGTHVLTYHNGCAQPFRQLRSGLAGYESLQEGLAVLAEYLVGGLSRPRVRLLAARVVAARHMLDGASFVEVFRELNRTHGFAQRIAFVATLRIYRGGGLTKDAVYLRGLLDILDYLRNGGELDPLYVGKIAIEHIPIIDELRWRGVLREPPLKPRYLQRQDTSKRLARVRRGVSVTELIDGGHT
jgi:uncharacterized protein (TIGR02421 family)